MIVCKLSLATAVSIPSLDIWLRRSDSAPMRRAGLPATIEYGGTSAVTTAHAETMLPSPIVTPGKMTARPPIQTLSATTIGFTSASNAGTLSRRACGSAGWPGESNIHTPAAILQFRPIVMLLPTVKEQPWPMPVPLPIVSVGAGSVPRCKREAAFSVDQHVVADDEIAATLHPVDEDVRSNVAAVTAAVAFEQRFGNEDTEAASSTRHAEPKRPPEKVWTRGAVSAAETIARGQVS